jgi:phosphate uptake regulator|tara:strand:- start:1149 stop:1814 length:666 start_codon:yes stop_codon:yes gene_type:complete
MFKQIFEIFKSDSLYEQALTECHEMLEIVREMFNESINSLRNSDTAEIPIDIYATDKKINEFERDVRRKVMTHLAIGGKEDIGSGLILVSVVIDIERIGDYTKNIYDLALNHPKKLTAGSLESTLNDMENSTKEFLNKAIDAFKNQDIDLARSLMTDYKKEIASTSNDIVNALVSGQNAEFSSDKASALCLYARYLKRIAAHSRNLVSSIVNPFERIGYPE